jgi:molybdate transport system substrate-binding protein
MKKFVLLAGFLAFLSNSHQAFAQMPEVTVFTAGPLARVMAEISGKFAEKGLGRVGLITGHTPEHAKQIISGAPGDIFVGVDGPWVGEMVEKKVLNATTLKPLLSNSLVMVARADSSIAYGAKSGEPLGDKLNGGLVAIADPAMAPAGRFSQQALTSLGAWAGVEGKLAFRPNLPGVVAAVENGEAAVGIVQRSDAIANGKLKVLAEFPADAHQPMVTVAALLSKGETPKAKAFHDFLFSPDARAIFDRYGFGTPKSK